MCLVVIFARMEFIDLREPIIKDDGENAFSCHKVKNVARIGFGLIILVFFTLVVNFFDEAYALLDLRYQMFELGMISDVLFTSARDGSRSDSG